MEGLKNAKNAIKKATDELVRVAKDSLKQETVTMDIKPDIFKEVTNKNSLYCHWTLNPFYIKIIYSKLYF